MFVMVIQETVC